MTQKRGRKKQENAELSKMELEIMDVVWRLGDCTSAEVIHEYRKTRNLAETTIRTVLANVRKKGFVELAPTTARNYRYRPAVSREKVGRRNLKSLVKVVFEGSPRQAIAYLLEDAGMDDAELDAIRAMIDQRKKRGKNE